MSQPSTPSAPDRERADLDRLPPAARAVLEFWFGDRGELRAIAPRREWFAKDATFDARVRERFSALIEQALRGSLADWTGPSAAVAHILVLDQFTRNAFRGTARSFEGDALALATAQRVVASGDDMPLPPLARGFVYLPFEHAEDAAAQDDAVRLFAALAAAHPEAADMLVYAERHRAVIRRFGRFPHRNALLGRTSSAAEDEFLKTPGSRF